MNVFESKPWGPMTMPTVSFWSRTPVGGFCIFFSFHSLFTKKLKKGIRNQFGRSSQKLRHDSLLDFLRKTLDQSARGIMTHQFEKWLITRRELNSYYFLNKFYYKSIKMGDIYAIAGRCIDKVLARKGFFRFQRVLLGKN